MRMVKFRVQNFKNVSDTDWINCQNLTCFVGKNESGKSSVLQGLSKINPSNKEQCNGLKEFPRKRYTIDFTKKDWPVCSANFKLTAKEIGDLSKISVRFRKVTNIIFTRRYSWKFDLSFEPEIICPNITYQRYNNLLKEWQTTVQKTTTTEEKASQLAPLKSSFLNFISEAMQKVNDKTQNAVSTTVSLVDDLNNKIQSQITQNWQKETFGKLIDGINQFKSDIELAGNFEQARLWVEKNIPKFVYFDEINVIDSAINIPDFLGRLNSNPSDHRLRATKCLFDQVGLSLEDLLKLDPTKSTTTITELRKMADERAIKMSAASTAMTDMFCGWWDQRDHKFRYQVDGPSFRVWVSDNLDPSYIELDQRSQGMQYFFSFYLVFLVEAEGAHSNSIILLDEPALHLHGTAQQKVVKFLENLSDKNQLFYTTHSPFMIDGDHLENVRVISENQDGTVVVSEKVWPKDNDALFPLQAGLGYSIAQTLFYSKRQVVVEGLTDYWFLKAINSRLIEKKMGHLRSDIAIVPCGGTKKLLPLASMLIGNDIQVVALLDGDDVGRQKGREAKSSLQLNCIFINDYTGETESEIEDLLPEKMYLDAVKSSYPEIGHQLTFSQEEDKIKCITKRVKKAFERLGKEYEKFGPSTVIVDLIREKPDALQKETLEKFETLFKAINEKLPMP
jgi:predicted ATP-dependent endonuclease of OLD family